MAGPNKATWVKVVGKGGRVTTRAIGMTQGGANFTQGQTITQSEFNEVRKKAAEQKTSKPKDIPSRFNISDYSDPQFLDIVSTQSSAGKVDKKKVEELSDALLAGGGNIRPIIVKQTGNESYEVVQGQLEFEAIKRAKEKNPSFEMYRAIILDYNPGKRNNDTKARDKAVMEQLSLLDKFPREVPLGAKSANPKPPKTKGYDIKGYSDYQLVDIVSVKTSAKKGDVPQKDIDALARTYLNGGGNIRPFILKRSGPEDFEVVSGQKEFLAAQRAKELVPSFEMVRGIILNPKNTDGVLAQLAQ